MSREYPTLPIVAVGVIVFKEARGGPEVLLIRRGVEPAFGKWSVPGGGVEIGETLREAAAREVKEETGLDVEVGPLVEVIERVLYDDKGRIRFHYVILDYAARWLAGEAQADSDVSEVCWVRPEHVEKMDTTVGLAPIVWKAREMMERHNS